ncbi:MAG: SUF system NifU family Fe-S cluster assembly protein [candidate division Zixibacteria bacterium]|nr:SUF system NifU family Fe-S cluster assembly protein [candidate division Zixibacteria bacterium]
MSAALDDMYRDIIMDHYRAPRGRHELPMADFSSNGHNPSCGDELKLQVKLEDGIVKDIYLDCKGCAISVASGSMLAEAVKGKSVADAKRIAEVVKKMLKGEDFELPDDLEDLDALQGVRKFPVRIKCALLAWVTFMEGLDVYESGETGSSVTTEIDK